MRRTGMTVVELVIVVAVIAILAAILFPVTGHRSGHDARRTACQSNLKLILLGTLQYTQDYDNKFPLLASGNLPPSKGSSSGYICTLQPYVKSMQIFQCPSEANSQLGRTDYLYNAQVLAGREVKKFRNGANTVIYADSNETAGDQASASAPTVLNRHRKGSNYAFADGHVKWLRSDNAPTDSKTPATASNFTFGP